MFYKVFIHPDKMHMYYVMMDWNHELVKQLFEALNADERLDCRQFISRKDINAHIIHLCVIDKELLSESIETQKQYIYAICERVLEPNKKKDL